MPFDPNDPRLQPTVWERFVLRIGFIRDLFKSNERLEAEKVKLKEELAKVHAEIERMEKEEK